MTDVDDMPDRVGANLIASRLLPTHACQPTFANQLLPTNSCQLTLANQLCARSLAPSTPSARTAATHPPLGNAGPAPRSSLWFALAGTQPVCQASATHPSDLTTHYTAPSAPSARAAATRPPSGAWGTLHCRCRWEGSGETLCSRPCLSFHVHCHWSLARSVHATKTTSLHQPPGARGDNGDRSIFESSRFCACNRQWCSVLLQRRCSTRLRV
jgi:hypothetical protein